MKNAKAKSRGRDLLPEYDFSRGVRGKYVRRFAEGTNLVKLEPDGTGTRTYRQIVQILTPEAAEQWGEQSFGYSTDREKLTLNWARVLRPDGSVVRHPYSVSSPTMRFIPR